MLLSVINMKLRDEYSDLNELCASLDIDRADLESKLEKTGFRYDSATNQFR